MPADLSVYERSLLLYFQELETALGQAPVPGMGMAGMDAGAMFQALQPVAFPVKIPSPAGALGLITDMARGAVERLLEAPAGKAEKPMTVREEKKQQTRAVLLEAALTLARSGGGFASLSLREVTREAGLVPTAFYRHFRDLDELGLALVDDACLTLRRLLREARMQAMGAGDVAIQDSIRTYLGYVRQHAAAFEFLTRERSGGSGAVREAIAREIRYFVSELAADLRLFPHYRDFPADDLEMISDLVVNTIAALALDILSLPAGQLRLEQDIENRAIKQLRLIFLGAAKWRPDLGAVQPAIAVG
jgi:AcrR family transcriptional regulator